MKGLEVTMINSSSWYTVAHLHGESVYICCSGERNTEGTKSELPIYLRIILSPNSISHFTYNDYMHG